MNHHLWFIITQFCSAIQHLNISRIQPIEEQAVCTVVVGRAEDAPEVSEEACGNHACRKSGDQTCPFGALSPSFGAIKHVIPAHAFTFSTST